MCDRDTLIEQSPFSWTLFLLVTLVSSSLTILSTTDGTKWTSFKYVNNYHLYSKLNIVVHVSIIKLENAIVFNRYDDVYRGRL